MLVQRSVSRSTGMMWKSSALQGERDYLVAMLSRNGLWATCTSCCLASCNSTQTQPTGAAPPPSSLPLAHGQEGERLYFQPLDPWAGRREEMGKRTERESKAKQAQLSSWKEKNGQFHIVPVRNCPGCKDQFLLHPCTASRTAILGDGGSSLSKSKYRH